jgi:hypothetical protein
MRPTSKECVKCGVKRSRNAFLRAYKQRVIEYPECTKCYEEKLLRDASGRLIAREFTRGFINEITHNRLRDALKLRRKQNNEARKAALSRRMTKVWEKRRDLEQRFGIRTPTIKEAQQFLADPAARAAFDREQAVKRAAYEDYQRKDAARRAKISASMTGRKRAPYMTAKKRLAQGKAAPAENGHEQ